MKAIQSTSEYQINNHLFLTIKASKVKKKLSICLAVAASLTLSACMSTAPKMGGSSGNTVTGGAAGANAANNNTGLEKCEQPLGTLSVFEDTSLTWWHDYRRRYPTLGSTIPVIRLMIQQSNCFVVVERGKAMAAMNRERQLMQSGQLRGGSNLGGGQMVAADYTISPEIQFSAKGTQGIKAVGGALLGSLGSLIGGGAKKNEAATTLILIDNRSGVQVSAAVGSAGNWDFDVFGGLFAGGAIGGAGAFSNTPEGKVLSAAFADSYNQMVKALRNYKAQQVKGGLGKGGQLKVGGADDATPQATKGANIVAAPKTQPRAHIVHDVNVTTTSKRRDYNFEIDEYDEDAMEDYYRSLKDAAKTISAFAAISSSSMADEHKSMAASAINVLAGQMASNKIELEHWPLSAKQEAWRVLGKRIEKHNKIFEMHRTQAINNKYLSKDVVNTLASIELITKKSLFGG